MSVPIQEHSKPEVLRAVVVIMDKKTAHQSDMVTHRGVKRIAAYSIR